MNELPFVTSETDLAVYLILLGFDKPRIQYEPRQNGRKRGIFIFSRIHPTNPDYDIDDFKNKYESGQAIMNISDFKEEKTLLMDRLMQEKP
jgi:hypothetical protein